jgi:hypothetical protein
VLAALRHLDPWLQFAVVATPAESLGELTPLEALHNRDIDGAVAAAEAFAQALSTDR